jgi:hypothetical protein
MKKLKLFGEKDLGLPTERQEMVADVFVAAPDNVIVVESKYPDVKRELADALDQLVKNGGAMLRSGFTRGNEHISTGSYKKPSDENFLETLRDDGAIWWDKKFGGYKIDRLASKIVEE